MSFENNPNLPVTRLEAGNCRLEDVISAYRGLPSDAERASYRSAADKKAITVTQPLWPKRDFKIYLQAPDQEFGFWWDPPHDNMFDEVDAKLEHFNLEPAPQPAALFVQVTVEGSRLMVKASVETAKVSDLVALLQLYKEYLEHR